MSTTKPNPATEGQLKSGDPWGAWSCVSYSFSYAVAIATNGLFHPSGRLIRDWTGDRSGGLELGQCERAVELHRPSLKMITTVLTRAQFYGKLDAGYVMILLGGYDAIASTHFSGQPGFRGNHGVAVDDRRVMDPLADGTPYLYHRENYPPSVIDAFAARLLLGNGNRAGSNHYEVTFARIAGGAPIDLPDYNVRIEAGNVGMYRVDTKTRTVIGNPRNHHVAKPIVLRCSRPGTYAWAGHHSARLVRVVSGPQPLKGEFVSVKNPRVHLEER